MRHPADTTRPIEESVGFLFMSRRPLGIAVLSATLLLAACRDFRDVTGGGSAGASGRAGDLPDDRPLEAGASGGASEGGSPGSRQGAGGGGASGGVSPRPRRDAHGHDDQSRRDPDGIVCRRPRDSCQPIVGSHGPQAGAERRCLQPRDGNLVHRGRAPCAGADHRSAIRQVETRRAVRRLPRSTGAARHSLGR